MSNTTTYRHSEPAETPDGVAPDNVPVAPQITFAIIPEWLLDSGVSGEAVKLYGILARYANDKTGLAYPKRRTLADRMGKTTRSITTYIRELESVGALISTPRYHPGTREQAGNYYTVMSMPNNVGLKRTSTPPGNTFPSPPEADFKPRTIANEPEPVNDNPPNPPADESTQGELNIVAESAPPAGGGSKPKRNREQYPPEFAAFWEVYPKKADKRAALKAWRAAKKRALVSDDELVVAAMRYRDDPNRVDQFTKNPATWLNKESWENGPLPARTGNNRAQERLNNNLSVVQYFAEQENTNENFWGELER